jgi:hypothetical protein
MPIFVPDSLLWLLLLLKWIWTLEAPAREGLAPIRRNNATLEMNWEVLLNHQA